MDEFKEFVREIITNQGAKVGKKIKKIKHQLLSIQTKDILSKQGDQANIFSSFKETYDNHLDNMINNNKLSNKFVVASN